MLRILATIISNATVTNNLLLLLLFLVWTPAHELHSDVGVGRCCNGGDDSFLLSVVSTLQYQCLTVLVGYVPLGTGHHCGIVACSTLKVGKAAGNQLVLVPAG